MRCIAKLINSEVIGCSVSLNSAINVDYCYVVGGAVALDGRIEPGDMILQVNDTNFENMSNDDAVKILRDVVTKPG